jgi:hypothetical protein
MCCCGMRMRAGFGSVGSADAAVRMKQPRVHLMHACTARAHAPLPCACVLVNVLLLSDLCRPILRYYIVECLVSTPAALCLSSLEEILLKVIAAFGCTCNTELDKRV